MGQPHRIMVYGVTGSGKTVAAAEIAARTGLPFVEIDEITWDPGWTKVPIEEQRRRIGAIVSGDAWVLDHGYGTWLGLVADRVELVVALDYPRWVSLNRLVRRGLVNVLTRRSICHGNVETWQRLLGPESILRWHARSFSSKWRRVRAWDLDQIPPTVRLSRPRHLRRWMNGLERTVDDPGPGTNQG